MDTERWVPGYGIQSAGSRDKAMEYRTLGPGIKLWNTERWVPG